MNDREKLIKAALNRKEKFISQNTQYRKWESIHHRHTAGKYIGDFIYGANDGLITTFAIVAGVVGANLSPTIVIILGFANILADGLSMGASNYLGSKSEQDYAKAQREKEDWEIDNLRELEIDEIREIFERKGFKGEDLEKAVSIIISNRKVWVDTMMKDELGIIEDESDDPKKHGIATFLAFLCAGLIPLLPYLFPMGQAAFSISIALGLITLFVIGALRSAVTTVAWLRGGLEMLFVGSAAAGAAYIVGNLLEKIVG